MPIDLQARSQYLTLALFAQKTVSALIEYADEGNVDRMRPVAMEALTSLRGLDDVSSLAQRRAVAFTSYEHLRTLEEVWTTADRLEAISLLEHLTADDSSPAQNGAKAARLIELFARLQNQALWNFEQPKPVSAQVLQQLCQMT